VQCCGLRRPSAAPHGARALVRLERPRGIAIIAGRRSDRCSQRSPRVAACRHQRVPYRPRGECGRPTCRFCVEVPGDLPPIVGIHESGEAPLGARARAPARDRDARRLLSRKGIGGCSGPRRSDEKACMREARSEGDVPIERNCPIERNWGERASSMPQVQQSYAHIATGGAHAIICVPDGVFNVAPPSSLAVVRTW
jgi:hypothetical protein